MEKRRVGRWEGEKMGREGVGNGAMGRGGKGGWPA